MGTYLGIVAGSVKVDDNIQNKDGTELIMRAVRETHIVLSDTTSESVDDIKATTGVPVAYQTTSNGVLCRDVRAKEIDTLYLNGVSRGLWHLSCVFDSELNADDEQQPPSFDQDDPESRPPIVAWSLETIEEDLQFDAVTGLPVQTAACEKILVRYPVTIPVYRYTRYELGSFDPNTILNYENHTNEDEFLGAPTGCAHMSGIEATEEYIKNVLYNRVTYIVKFRLIPITARAGSVGTGGFEEDGWAAKPLHQGYYYIPDDGVNVPTFECGGKTSNKLPRLNVDAKGKAVITLLNEDGGKIGSDEANYLKFNKYPKADFSSLNITK